MSALAEMNGVSFLISVTCSKAGHRLSELHSCICERRDFANTVVAACAKRGQRCLLTTGDHGYYIPRLSRYAGLSRGGGVP